MFAVPRSDLAWVLGLVNEFSDCARIAAGEQDRPYPRTFGLGGHTSSASELVAVANRLHAIFVAADRGEPIGAPLNAILDRARPWDRLTAAGAGRAVAQARHVLPAACALTLLEWIDARGGERIGICAGARCADVYADASAAGHRRFCSSTCANRHKVAQHRARRREQDWKGR